MKDDRYEIRFSGSGGQGIITMAIILAEAVGVYDQKYVCQTQSYGPEARGGTSKAEVVISNKPIDYPKAIKTDLLLAMNQASCNAYCSGLKPQGLLIVDSGFVEQIPFNRAVAIPFTQIAIKELKNQMVANMIALGAIASLSEIVSIKNLEKALKARTPQKTEGINLKALHAGLQSVKQYDITSLPESETSEDEDV
ncbi:MAG: 2-oxoacid:acceptor oxidoreductase family protein [Spirochaetota bacterium]|nr:2-oxoacid:acceptor oxidoreductase family protein [Spirochaetota bacterium]